MKKLSGHINKVAVALNYDQENAPTITARGYNQMAESIINIAKENTIPLHEDHGLCASLEQTKLGEEIPEELYLAVAEVIAFTYIVTGKFPPDF
jgi:flagellar biosynthesis protein